MTLAKGKHAIGFRWEGGAANSGGLDCFVLTNEPFVPQGTMKPGGEHPGVAAADAWFPLLADEDPFSPESVIDMSALVPAPAGELGALVADGKDLRFEKGTSPVKFWGVGANVQPGRYSREQLTRRARYLRKFGINVRGRALGSGAMGGVPARDETTRPENLHVPGEIAREPSKLAKISL